jgi:hypothetical protein
MAISDAQFAQWLKDAGDRRVLLAEIDFVYQVIVDADTGTPTVGTVYLADYPYVTEPGDTPANRRYRDCIAALPGFSQSIDTETLGGQTSYRIGQLELYNADGQLDPMLNLVVDGRECRLYLGDPSWARADFRNVMTAIVQQISAPAQDRISVALRDRGLLLNASIIGATVGGVGPNAGRPLPIICGYCNNVEAVLIDSIYLTYGIADTAARPVHVYDSAYELEKQLPLFYDLGSEFEVDTVENTILNVDLNLAIDDVIAITGDAAIDMNVIFLGHFDGANGSQSWVDSSFYAHGFNSVDSSVALSTTSPLFGSASLSCPGSGFLLAATSSADYQLGTGDWIIELAIKTATPSQVSDLLDFRNSAIQVASTLYITGGQFRYFVNNADRISGGTVATSTWQRVRVSRVSGTTRMFIDGTQVGSDYTDANDYNVTAPITFGGAFNGGAPFTGNIDEVRVTKGIGVAANYTVDAVAFPNPGSISMGLVSGDLYYVVATNPDRSFQLSTIRGGIAISLTAQFDPAETVYVDRYPWIDNSDTPATITLAHPPFGRVTVDVDVPIATNSRASDIIRHLVVDRGGVPSGNFTGPLASFTEDGAGDYKLGLAITERRNLTDVLDEVLFSVNGFWGFDRLSNFIYGRIRPQGLGALSIALEIGSDDIVDIQSLAVDHLQPTYKEVKGFFYRSWTDQTDGFAGGVELDRISYLQAGGLFYGSEPIVSTRYEDNPGVYHETMIASPEYMTLLSQEGCPVAFTEFKAWLEDRRQQVLPNVEAPRLKTNLTAYSVKLGDVVNLTLDRFGLDAGARTQVLAIDADLTGAVIALTLIRRHTADVTTASYP